LLLFEKKVFKNE
jgi:myosin heavy subunit